MYEVTPSCGQIHLGKQGENSAKLIYFAEPALWKKVFGEGRCELIHQRCGDAAPYPVALKGEGDNVYWEVSAADTAIPGNGKCELRYIVGDTVVKSTVWVTTVLPSLEEATAEVPDPEKSWVDQVLTAADEVKSATTHQPTISENKTWLVWDENTKDYVDTGVVAIGKDGVKYIIGEPGEAEENVDEVIAFIPYEDTYSIKVKVPNVSDAVYCCCGPITGFNEYGSPITDWDVTYYTKDFATGEPLYSAKVVNGIYYLNEVGTVISETFSSKNIVSTSLGDMTAARGTLNIPVADGTYTYKTVYDAEKVSDAIADAETAVSNATDAISEANKATETAQKAADDIKNAVKPETVAAYGRFAVYTHADRRVAADNLEIYIKQVASNRVALCFNHPLLKATQRTRVLEVHFQTDAEYKIQTSNESEQGYFFYGYANNTALDKGATTAWWLKQEDVTTHCFEVLLDTDAVANIYETGHFTINSVAISDFSWNVLGTFGSVYFDTSGGIAELGNIETALDTIISIQNELIGGDE